jgi:hypothetical protein
MPYAPTGLSRFLSEARNQFVKTDICDKSNMGGCSRGLSAANALLVHDCNAKSGLFQKIRSGEAGNASSDHENIHFHSTHWLREIFWRRGIAPYGVLFMTRNRLVNLC